MQTILARNLPLLALKTERAAQGPNNRDMARMSNVPLTADALRQMSVIPIFGDVIQKLLTHGFMNVPEVLAPLSEVQEVQQQISSVQFVATRFMSILQEVLPPQSSNSVSIEIPSNLSFENTLRLLIRINRVLSRIGCNSPTIVEVQNFDSGSLHLEILGKIVGKGTTEFARRLIISAGVAYSVSDWAIQRWAAIEQVRALDVVVDDMRATQALNTKVKERTRELLREQDPTLDHEELNRLVLVTIDLTRLLHEGVKLFPAANKPPEIPSAPPYALPPLGEVPSYLLTSGMADPLNELDEEVPDEPESDPVPPRRKPRPQ